MSIGRASSIPPFEPGQLNINWFIWRPVIRKVATYTEIMKYWTIKDLMDCHEALDLQDAADQYYHDMQVKMIQSQR